MKKYLIIIVLLFSFLNVSAGKGTSFFIAMKNSDDGNGKKSNAMLVYLEQEVIKKIKKIYPCAGVLTRNSVAATLNLEKQRQLLGSGDQSTITSVAQALGTDFLISLEVNIVKGKSSMTAICMSNRNAKTLSRAFGTAPYGEPSLDEADRILEQLFDGLKEYEICAFTGNITVDVHSTKNDVQKDENKVYCNGRDGIYKKETTVNKTTEQHWTLHRGEDKFTSGNVMFRLKEKMKIEEQNDCYECNSSKKQDRRNYTEESETNAEIEGLDGGNDYYGLKVDYSTVNINFSGNGTYTITIKAASTKGTGNKQLSIRTMGSCGNLSNDSLKTVPVSVPLRIVCGPFKGTAQDKVLAYEGPLFIKDPVTKEESKIKYKFELRRP